MSNAFTRLALLAALTAGVAQAACSTAFYPVSEGLSRTYQTTVKGQTRSYTETISQVTPTSFTMTNSLMPGASSTSKCGPNGIVAVTQTAAPGMKVTDMRGVTYPAKLAVGTVWQSGVTMKGDVQGQAMQSVIAVKSVVVGREKVKVKAGTFDAFKVKTTTTMKMQMAGQNMSQPPLEGFMWVAEGVGMVKTNSGGATIELVKFSK